MTQAPDAREERGELLLIDASSSIYRAFYAIPALRSPGGVPTNAVLGFANMLQKALREERPRYAVVVWDSPGKTRRHALYPEYKAQRDATPDDLRAQLPHVRSLVEGYRIASMEYPGEEADDVIATLATRASERGLRVVIVSTDRDLMQLVGERVELLDTMRGRRFGPAQVEEKFGVPPEQMLDYRALTGDSSDNIPGVRGIGEKSAAALLKEYGTLEAVLEAGERIRAKRARDALREGGADSARLSRDLARLRADLPVDFDLERFALREPDREQLRALFVELDLRRLLQELEGQGGGAAVAAPAASAASIERIEDADALRELVHGLERAGRVGVAAALEPEEPMQGRLAGLALASSAQSASFVPLGGDESAARLARLRPLLERESLPWVGFGLKDLKVALARAGIELAGPLCDLGVAAYVDDPGQALRPETLARRYLNRELASQDDLFGRGAKRQPFDEASPEALSEFLGARAALALPLADALRAQLADDDRAALLEELEMPLCGVLARMELVGVRVDESALERLSSELGAELERIEEHVYALAGERFNIGSPKQLQKILFEKLALPPSRRTKTGFSTDEAVLENLATEHEIAAEIVGYRHLSKLKGTYLDALPKLIHPETGRIHCRFNQAVASTGRLSTSAPNLQNIPVRSAYGARIREAFVPAEDRLLLSADYSQIELRILAHFSEDPALLEVFQRGGDVHVDTAARVFDVPREQVTAEQRSQMKAVNFGILYGSSAFGLARQLGISQGRAAEQIQAYFERFPGVRSYLDRSIETARERGYAQTLFGRRRFLPELGSRNRAQRAAAERMAMNSAIQGTAADLIKRAMVRIDGDLAQPGAPRAQMILQVHDELLFEVSPAEADALQERVVRRMQGVAELRVPLEVHAGRGRNWREAH